jgi:hypothetical protein
MISAPQSVPDSGSDRHGNMRLPFENVLVSARNEPRNVLDRMDADERDRIRRLDTEPGPAGLAQLLTELRAS